MSWRWSIDRLFICFRHDVTWNGNPCRRSGNSAKGGQGVTRAYVRGSDRAPTFETTVDDELNPTQMIRRVRGVQWPRRTMLPPLGENSRFDRSRLLPSEADGGRSLTAKGVVGCFQTRQRLGMKKYGKYPSGRLHPWSTDADEDIDHRSPTVSPGSMIFSSSTVSAASSRGTIVPNCRRWRRSSSRERPRGPAASALETVHS